MSRKAAVKSLFVFCAVLLAVAPAFAQGVAFQASSLPQQVRVEGVTETVGAVVLQATGAGKIPGGSSITLVYSGAITNTPTVNVLSGSFGGAPCSTNTAAVPPTSCTGGAGSTATFAVTASGNQLTVQTVGATTTFINFAAGDYIVVSQVRVNVSALGAGAGAVSATMSGTSSVPTINPITFTQSTVPVASIVSPSVKTSFTAASAIQTCSIGTASTFSVKLAETYPAALTTTADETSFTPTVGPAPANGSNVQIVIAGVPNGMSVGYTGSSSATAGFAMASTTGAAIQTSTGAALTWTFTVGADSTSTAEVITLNFQIGVLSSGAFANGSIPALGATSTVTAAVSFAPVAASTTAPVTPVQFASGNSLGTGTAATVSDCVTNMLFPYVTNQGGYDTSFSIANTTNDDLSFGANLGAQPQSGTCTLSFWPTTDTTNVVTGTALTTTTPNIPSGAVYAFSQSGTTFSGQTGYMIAVCRFLNAHGFAFLTNGFAQAAGPQLSHGYLGLIIPNPVSGRNSASSESLVN